MRVLKPSGSIWVNLADKYSTAGGHTDNTASTRLEGRPNLRKQGRADRSTTTHGLATKSLFGLPWRYAIRCTDELGLILRRDQIWHKPTAMPESVTDRCKSAHEYWFHFTVRPRYFAAIDELRLPVSGFHRSPGISRSTPPGQRRRAMADTVNPLGPLPGSVWEIPTSPFTAPDELAVDHFAAFPPEWPRRLIRGWSPAEVCTACGDGRGPIIARPGLLGGDNNPASRDGSRRRSTMDGGTAEWNRRVANPDRIVGYGCSCATSEAPTVPSLVLDPFGGTGTTALVARALGRTGISVDRSGDYCRLAQWRVNDRAQLAKVLEKPAPQPVIAGQTDLFEEMA
jgi:DNA modification methylase